MGVPGKTKVRSLGRADNIHIQGTWGPNPTKESEKNGHQAVCSIDANN
jgi:hypothetical protein